MVTVGQLMKRELIAVEAGTSVVDAAKLMKACNVGSVLVKQDGATVGIVTVRGVGYKLRTQ
jgi:predicted transcriptional regulator